MKNETTKKIAIVYDWIDKWGGVERVLLTLHEMYPDAIFYTSYFNKDSASWAKNLNIKTSFLQEFPSFIKKSRILSFIFYPFAFESFDFSDYDLVISVTSSFAKSIITKPGTQHICYLLTPTRYLWSNRQDYLNSKRVNYLFSDFIKKIKNWDFVVAQRPDKIISISETVKKRCLQYYKRDSEIIYPPFDREYWNNIKSKVPTSLFELRGASKNKKYFLIVSRLEPYKKVNLAIKVFNKLNVTLIIVGDGTEEINLRKLAGKNIIFLSKLSDVELGNLYSNAQALIMPQEEDFGLVSLEAQFFGCPVIAYNKGGGLETVIDGKTGIFFNHQEEISLVGAIERFNKIEYNLRIKVKEFGKKNTERFSKEKFIGSFLKIL